MIKRVVTDEEGQALTEFAMVLPVLLLVLFGIIQFGIAFNNYIDVTSAAREGARTGAVSRSLGCSGAATAITQAADGSATNLNQAQLTVTSNLAALCSANNGSIPQGGSLTVTVTYPYSISLLGLVVSNGSLSSSTSMRIE
ncbi:MAG TPA: TadE/TadG family type IV pilus assembly protein [Acidothermaceae bacterium]|nr:TadE/TadG family type IV pilus assembly protein [Acidothermaceae bacterium]